MAFSIEEFKGATFQGLAKPSKYRATIFFNKLNVFSAQRLSILCESAQLPSRSFRTEPEFMYGVARKMPLHMTYDDFSLQYICTYNMPEKKFFDKWTSFICNPTSNYMHYYDDYKSNIKVETFNDDGTVSYSMLIEEAYPININVQQLAYGETDSYLKLNIDFAYKKWRNSEEVATGDTMNQGYQFTPTSVPVSNSQILSGDWKLPDSLPGQEGTWSDTKNPWTSFFEIDTILDTVENGIQDATDQASGLLNQTIFPIADAIPNFEIPGLNIPNAQDLIPDLPNVQDIVNNIPNLNNLVPNIPSIPNVQDLIQNVPIFDIRNIKL